jgi:hypothetical protein
MRLPQGGFRYGTFLGLQQPEVSLRSGSPHKRQINGWRTAHPEEVSVLRRRLVSSLPVLRPAVGHQDG